jgi:dihydrolipoamide dehydrogenase
MTHDMQTTRLTVIGAGPGGYAAAFLAADLGLEVTLVDPEANPGGVCLYRGCIPSKALLHVAGVLREAGDAQHCGVAFGPPRIELEKLRSWNEGVVKSLTDGLGQLTRQRRIGFIRGRARFVDARTLEIERIDGSRETLGFEHAIIATGSRPAALPGVHIDSPRVLDSSAALRLDSIPKSLLVVGGGYIGLELGTVYAALGTRVTVAEMMPALLPGVDTDLVSVLHKRLESVLASIFLETTASQIKEQKNGVEVRLQGKGIGEKEMFFEKVLVAVGRVPNSSDLGIENAGVEISERGFIRVDTARRTRIPSILAVGDVVGEPMLAHKASHEGRVAAEVVAGGTSAFEPRAIPAVVFTDPQIAWCGLAEQEAREANRSVKVVRFPWAASGRARTLGRSDGLTKLVIDPATERVLGVGIVGPGAGELIAEGVLAVEMAATVRDLALTIHPHPTLSETMMEAAEVFFGQSTHLYRPRKR